MGKMNLPWFAAPLLLAMMGASAHGADEVQYATFKIAGGESITVPITDAGALPAENEHAQVTSAGLLIEEARKPAAGAVLLWHFEIAMKAPSKKLASVRVEEVWPSRTAVTLVDDTRPRIEDGSWSAISAGTPADAPPAAWLQSDEPSIFIFRMTVTPKAGEPYVLHQLAWFPRSQKKQFRQMVAWLGKP